MLAALTVLMLSAPPSADSAGAAVSPVGLQALRVKNYRPMGLGYSEVILLRVALEGQAVKDGFRYGNVAVSEAKDDAGNDLRITTGPATSHTDKVGTYLLNKPEKTAGAVLFDIRMKHPAPAAKGYSLKGTLEVHSIEARVNADISGVKPGEEGDLKHVELEAAGLKVKVVKPASKDDKTIVLHIEGDDSKIDGYEIVADGKAAKAAVKVLKGAKGDAAKDRWLQFADKLPAELTLRVVLLKGLKSRTVPFEFSKLELP